MENMSSAEFSLWTELYRLDKWGQKVQDERDDYRTGLACSTIANYAGKVRSAAAGHAKPEDFMPLQEAVPAAEPDPVAFFTAVAASKKFDR